MKRHITFFLTCVITLFIVLPSCAQKLNKLTGKEKKAGWVLLFNGKDFTGWRQYNGTTMPKNWLKNIISFWMALYYPMVSGSLTPFWQPSAKINSG